MDPKIDIKQFALKEEAAAKAWFGTNWAPVSVGLIVGMLAEWVLHKL